ncbi:MAG TPA: hypothetical protein VF069_28100 [Streptosporangiaceae bacterium]
MYTGHSRSPQYDEAAAIVRETKDVQDAVVSALIQYLELSERMREFEDAFSAQILSTAGELFMMRTKRKQLEAAYDRIRKKMNNGEYGDDGEIREDVDAALQFLDIEADALDAVPGEQNRTSGWTDSDELDTATKERIYRAFRRIVLPRVHSDTSDADVSEFEVAFFAYQSRDYTVMEAFVIRYRENIGLEEDGQLLTLAQLTTRLKEYQSAQKRLDNRLRVMHKEVTSAEIKAPEQARKRMEEQGEKFRQAIMDEAAKLRGLQESLESLAGSAGLRKGAKDG